MLELLHLTLLLTKNKPTTVDDMTKISVNQNTCDVIDNRLLYKNN